MKDKLEDKARWVRQQVLEMIVCANKGHIGGTLSCVDILVALYYGILKRGDKFILSKGHACAALYAILADKGYFPAWKLGTFGQEGSPLEGHPNITISGVDVTTGSLGHGLGIGAGLALANRKSRVFVLLSDGECYEGSTWEAGIFAAHHKLSNLIGIIDRNQQTVLGFTEDICKLEPLACKWKAFGWEVGEVNGHDIMELCGALHYSEKYSERKGKPLMLIANTIKGKGISFMEDVPQWHNKVPTKDEYYKALEELGGY